MSMQGSADDPRYGLGYALAAYIVFLGGFFAYLAWVHLRCARLQRRLETLERQVEGLEGR